MKPKISIMQGRLLPPFEGRFQAYPAIGWEKEFYEAEKLGIYSIEWIYEKPYERTNALCSDFGLSEIQNIIKKTGVQVRSICADFYMTEHLIERGDTVLENWKHLEWFCIQAKKLDIEYIVLPFVDSSSLNTDNETQILVNGLREFLLTNKNQNIEIHLETDLHPKKFLTIFKQVDHPLLKLNYDIGNSASIGYDPDEEFNLLGEYLGSVHIKDRALKGKTVSFGTGNADFKKCFQWFQKLKFNRWFVLQGARGEDGDEIQNISSQIDFALANFVDYGS